MGFLGGSVVKNVPDNVGDTGSIPGSGRCPGEGNSNPFQYSCLGNPWTEEPGGLRCLGSQRLGHDWETNASPHVRWGTQRSLPLFAESVFSIPINTSHRLPLKLWEILLTRVKWWNSVFRKFIYTYLNHVTFVLTLLAPFPSMIKDRRRTNICLYRVVGSRGELWRGGERGKSRFLKYCKTLA